MVIRSKRIKPEVGKEKVGPPSVYSNLPGVSGAGGGGEGASGGRRGNIPRKQGRICCAAQALHKRGQKERKWRNTRRDTGRAPTSGREDTHRRAPSQR